ncbi:hypothetical protein SLE2022_313470 [Rubroshorea leprosula]|uniref:Uncharacterized protein n=1 Tax=Rubroshorea leprosula TaxID=152421 RepID=A0AAV5MD41_9ROSI|nr:hypothetical protein SLEP1_g54647 [Rubroshorea leprosula]
MNVITFIAVILSVISRKLDKKLSRKPELPRTLRIAAELLRMPIGVPLLLLGVPISLSGGDKSLVALRGK